MLIDGQCSIYEHRPQTCRTYDCRVFTAAGVDLDDAEKILIATRARRWQFDHPTDADRAEHDAVRAAAAFIDRHPEILPEGATPMSPTQRAVLAVEIHELFLGDDRPASEAVGAVIARRGER